jgi:hypothetical protein
MLSYGAPRCAARAVPLAPLPSLPLLPPRTLLLPPLLQPTLTL